MSLKKILVFFCTHGHERLGARVASRFAETPAEGVSFLPGNPEAMARDVAFLESDLNRVFPGNPAGTLEERRAAELTPSILSADIVFDIHSTSVNDLGENSMLIVTKLDEETRRVLQAIAPPKVLVMGYRSGNALISQARVGVAFEYGMDQSRSVEDAVVRDLTKALVALGALPGELSPNQGSEFHRGPTRVFEVYDVFRKTFSGAYRLAEGCRNFERCAAGSPVCVSLESGETIYAEEDFVPVLFGEKRYTDILGFKARPDVSSL